MLRGNIILAIIALTPLCNGYISSKFHGIQTGKIVGGETISIEEASYQVSIFTKYLGHNCGGSIISNNLILTAAHCVKGSYGQLLIRAGSSFTNMGGQTAKVSAFKYHEKFSFTSMDYDVAIMKLSEPLTFDKFVGPIKIIDKNFTVEDGANAVVTGWGTTQEGGEIAQVLQRVIVPVVNQKDCQDAYADYMPVTDTMMCAGIARGGKDACQGDSGGPLTVSGFLTGIVSWGVGCARPQYPGIYTRISAVTDWIQKTMEEFEQSSP